MNVENYKAVIEHIAAHPETWDQSQWHCGTKHCLAGWAQIMAGKPENTSTVRHDARVFLGLTMSEADHLFAPGRTLSTLQFFANSPDGYDRDGYDRDGYDRDGYDRDGYDRDGYSRAWYNRDGYSRAGYDRDGYNRAGYNRDGYSRAGYNRDGYSRDGLNRENQGRAI